MTKIHKELEQAIRNYELQRDMLAEIKTLMNSGKIHPNSYDPGEPFFPDLPQFEDAQLAVVCRGCHEKIGECTSTRTCDVIGRLPDGTFGTIGTIIDSSGCEQRGFLSRLGCRIWNVFA